MKKLKKLGKALTKAEQKTVSGGRPSLNCFRKQEGDSCTSTPGGVVGTCVYPHYTTDYLYCSYI